MWRDCDAALSARRFGCPPIPIWLSLTLNQPRPASVYNFVSEIALVTWVGTVLGGLFLLAIWLIEYDPDIQRAAATRLPVPVISGHAVLAIAGLVVWVAYLITDDDNFAWLTLAILAVVVCLGATMAVRWIGVYRSSVRSARAKALVGAGAAPGDAPREFLVPPERHFPVSVVIGHGIFACTTIVLVLLTTLGVGGS
jgi:hypothetical protein